MMLKVALLLAVMVLGVAEAEVDTESADECDDVCSKCGHGKPVDNYKTCERCRKMSTKSVSLCSYIITAGAIVY